MCGGRLWERGRKALPGSLLALKLPSCTCLWTLQQHTLCVPHTPTAYHLNAPPLAPPALAAANVCSLPLFPWPAAPSPCPQSCPRPAHGSAQKRPGNPLDLQGLHRSVSGNSLPSGLRLPQLSYRSTTSEAALPEGLQLSSRSSCLEAALGPGGSAAMLTSRSCASEPAPPPQLSSRSSCSSRSTTVAEKFQKGLQPLAVVGGTESPPGSPDAFKLLCEKEEGEATTWLLDAAPTAERNGSTYHTPAPGGSPAASYRVQLLGFASPPNRNGAYGATCGGSTGRKQQAARSGAQQQLSMSMPTSPRVLRRLQSAGGADDLSLHAQAQQAAAQQPQSAARLAALRASVAGGEALQFSRFAPDGSAAPGSGDLGVSGPLSRVQQLQRRELPAVSRSLSCLAELRAAAASASASGASTPQTTARLAGSKIPKLPPSHPGTPSAAAGGPVDFKLGTFWSSSAEESNTAVSTRTTSPTGGWGSRAFCF